MTTGTAADQSVVTDTATTTTEDDGETTDPEEEEEDDEGDEEGEEIVLQEDEEEEEEEAVSNGDGEALNNHDEDSASPEQPSSSSVLVVELEAISSASKAKEEGNAHYANQKFRPAVLAYSKGLDSLAQAASGRSIAASSSSPSPAIQELHVSLRSNLAQAYLKVQDYVQAERQCSIVLEQWDDSIPKIWYRRAMAREQLALSAAAKRMMEKKPSISNHIIGAEQHKTTSTTNHPEALLQLALEDLRVSAQLLQEQELDEKMKKTARTALERVQNRLRQWKEQEEPLSNYSSTAESGPRTTSAAPAPAVNNSLQSQSSPSSPHPPRNGSMNGYHHVASTTATMLPAEPIIPKPEPSQQRQDVMRLLIARSIGLQKAKSNNTTIGGEALFVVDWKWWCQWCRHVDFFHTLEEEKDDDNENDDDGVKQERILKLLPPGAILPRELNRRPSTTKQDNHNKANKAGGGGGDETSSTDSDDDDDNSTEDVVWLDDSAPGILDNTALLLPSHLDNTQSCSSTQPSFYQQWYRHFQSSADEFLSSCDTRNNNNSGGMDNDSKESIITTAAPKVCLRPNLVRGFHYEIVPREVYCALKSWYREKTPPICRRTFVLQQQHASENKDPKKNGGNAQVQVPKIAIQLYPLSHQPTKVQQQENNKSCKICAACRARHATKRCARCMSVWYCDRACQEAHWPFHKGICSKTASGKHNNDSHHPYHADGRVGLNTLGNTCFMNSALQCLSHATPLTRHFLSNRFKVDLNVSNPLGTGGKLAHAFDIVLKDLWLKPNTTSTSPTALKRAIALFAPRFAGCLQHDAQEFLAYLLDGLHEDLNRIRQAPYVEMPDADHHGANMAVAGAEAWECHLRRNDSLVMDTFYGQFKSTCVCPNASCGRVSVSFDAFNHVSLEIPQLQKSTMWMQVLLFHNSPPQTQQASNNNHNKTTSPRVVRYAVCVRRGSLMADFRQALSQLCGIPPAQMALCEVSDHTIVEIINDNKPVAAVRADEAIITAYQIEPSNAGAIIHIIGMHALLEEKDKIEEVVEEEEKEDVNTSSCVRELFGFPFLTSISADMTCRQLWDYLWQRMRHMVLPLIEEGTEEEIEPEMEQLYQQLVDIRVTDGEGSSFPVFPVAFEKVDSNAGKEDDDEGTTTPLTPYLPREIDEKLIKFLGEDCTSRFLFLSFEWKQSIPVPQEFLQNASAVSGSGAVGNNKKKKKTKKNNIKAKIIPKAIGIEARRFMAFQDHPSYMEGLRKQRAMNAAKGVSLDQCFDTFTKPERLDEHNMWYCSNCKEHVRALKTMELWRLPNILVVHLKRFEFRHGFRRDKLTTFVDFPLEGLDMSQHCAKWKNGNDSSNEDVSPPEQLYIDDNVPAVYDLFAVVNHYGRMGFGHYTAFARKWDEEYMSNEWALFDDSSVRSVGDGRGGNNGADSVVTPAAYVLFYRRRTFN
jgi:ubiquitin carboxyl-terminal hydrolase 4/11/15